MKIIIGLGNPTDKYKSTRHNAGFIVLDALLDRCSGNFALENKFKAEIAKCNVAGEQVLLVKPQTFMNLSGDSLALVMNYFKVGIEDIIVVYDDIALEMGTLRFRANGSDGGHNGIKSIIKNLGNNNKFARLKVGIGPQPPMMPSERFVLGEFSTSEKELFADVSKVACNALESWLKEGIQAAQCKFNGKINL